MSVFSKVTLSLNDFMNKILIGNDQGAVHSTESRVLHPLSLYHPQADLGESPFANLSTVCVCACECECVFTLSRWSRCWQIQGSFGAS